MPRSTSDENRIYRGLPSKHETVNHSVGEYVNLMAHTNRVELFWSMLKRGYHGTHHHMSGKRLGCYVGEFEGRHNLRESDTGDQVKAMARRMDNKRLRYKDLISDCQPARWEA